MELKQTEDRLKTLVGRFLTTSIPYGHYEIDDAMLIEEARLSEILAHNSAYRCRQLLEDLYEITTWFTAVNADGEPLSNLGPAEVGDTNVVTIMMFAGYDEILAEFLDKKGDINDPVLKKYFDRLHSMYIAWSMLGAEATYMAYYMKIQVILGTIYMQVDYMPPTPAKASTAPTQSQIRKFKKHFKSKSHEFMSTIESMYRVNQAYLDYLNRVDQTRKYQFGHPEFDLCFLREKWQLDIPDIIKPSYPQDFAEYEWRKCNFITKDRLPIWLRALLLYSMVPEGDIN